MDVTTVLLICLIGYIIYTKFKTQILQFLHSNTRERSTYFKDEYKSVKEVSEALRKADVESCNLIIGIDFTSSNLHQGTRTFQGRSLHSISSEMLNPYQQVISIIGKTLENMDEDRMIPTFGFGDLSTKDHSVFPFISASSLYCNGVEEVLSLYNHIAPTITLSGPTSFVPLIEKAIEIVCQKQVMEYHILLIIADGQVSNEVENQNAIVKASEYPLSIIMIGVGDGPWEIMEQFDDELPQRKFDNFQFVNYSQVIQSARKKFERMGNEEEMKNLIEAEFSLAALMEIPQQYKACKELGLLANLFAICNPFSILMQTGFTELFSTQGSNTLDKFKLISFSKLPSEKQIQKIYDKDLKNFIVQIFQTTTKIRFPKQDKESLGMTHRYFIAQLCADSNDLYIEFLIKDTQMNRRRIIFSSSFGKISCNPLHAQFPLHDVVPRNAWCNIAFDLESLVSFAFVSQSIQFHCLEQVLLGGLCKIRKVFCSKMSPISEVILPKTLQFVNGVSYETKLIDCSTFGGSSNLENISTAAAVSSTEQHSHSSNTTVTTEKSPLSNNRPKTTAMMQSNKAQQVVSNNTNLFAQGISPQKLTKTKKPATAAGNSRFKKPVSPQMNQKTANQSNSFGRYSNEEDELKIDEIKVSYEENNYIPFHQKQNKLTIPSNELYNSQMYSIPSSTTENINVLSLSMSQKSSIRSSQQDEKALSDQVMMNFLEFSPPKQVVEEEPHQIATYKIDKNSFDELVNFTNSDSEEEGEEETKISREKTISPVLSIKSDDEEEELEHVIHSFSRKPLVELESEGEDEEEPLNHQSREVEKEEQTDDNSYLNYKEENDEEQYEQDEENDFSVEQQQHLARTYSTNDDDDEQEEDIELIYDPALNCYYDVKNNKYYALKNG